MQHQDWQDVVIRKPQSKKQAQCEAAAAGGGETVKRAGAGTNKANSSAGAAPPTNARRLDAETEAQPVQHVQRSVAQLIAQRRAALGLSQRELGVKINERQQLVADYEQGRAQPSQAVLGKLERALGLKLRGKDAGSPLQ